MTSRTPVRLDPATGKKIPPPVSPKPVRMTATRLTKANVRPPPPPQPSSGMKSTEEELDALTDLLVKNLENTGDPDFFGMCSKCGQKVSGEGTGCTAMDKLFHIKCFVCVKCGCQLTGKVFYKVEEQCFCEADYLETLEKCWVCNQHIIERILRATGKCFHPNCFKCEVCNKNLDGVQFTVDNFNIIHCVEDYYRKYSPRCASCNQLIVPEEGQEETVRIVSMNKDFHVKCYVCESLCQSIKAASHLYPFWPDCTNIILHGTRECQCLERLRRTCHHMDCFLHNYRDTSQDRQELLITRKPVDRRRLEGAFLLLGSIDLIHKYNITSIPTLPCDRNAIAEMVSKEFSEAFVKK